MFKQFLLFTLLLCSLSFAQDEVYSIPDEQFVEAISDGRLTFAEFGIPGATKFWDGVTYYGPFNVTFPARLAEYVDMTQNVTAVSDPAQFMIRLNGKVVRALDEPSNWCEVLNDSFSPDLINLGGPNSLEYAKCGFGSGFFSAESYFEFQLLAEPGEVQEPEPAEPETEPGEGPEPAEPEPVEPEPVEPEPEPQEPEPTEPEPQEPEREPEQPEPGIAPDEPAGSNFFIYFGVAFAVVFGAMALLKKR